MKGHGPHFERERLAAIVDSSQDAILSKTVDGIITSWNKAAERLFGYTADQIVGKSILTLIPPELHPEEQDILARLRRGERIESYETVRMRRDGSRIEVSLTISPIRDESGEVVGASKIARDIGARNAAERQVRESEQRYRSLVEASGAIVFNSDAQARWVQPNPAWEAYTGQTFGQYRDHGWLNAVHPDDRARVKQTSDRAVGTVTMFVAEGRVWHAPSKSWRWQEARAVPISDAASGQLREWVGTCTDVHARREAEEALLAADRRKDEFLATLAHELRNPLAPLANALEILRAEGVEPDARGEMVQVAQRQLEHLVRLVGDLMEASRITRGAIELQRETLLLGTAIHGAVEISRPLIDEKHQRLELDLPATQLLVEGDRTRLTQVVANLLNNAAKYTPPGGLIRVSAGREGAQAVLRVADNGSGIPPAAVEHIFEMFTQIETSPDRTQGGLGIGLSLVRRLVELHGGTVEAYSAGPGRGAEFIVRLPLARHVAPAAVEKVVRTQAATKPRRVLIADDNVDSARSLALLLELLGHEVHVAHDGRQALARALELRPEVLLLDIGMPGLTGHEVARQVREAAWGQRATLVALTGWGQDEDRRKSRESGFDHHFVKPVDMHTLQRLLAPAGPQGATPGVSH